MIVIEETPTTISVTLEDRPGWDSQISWVLDMNPEYRTDNKNDPKGIAHLKQGILIEREIAQRDGWTPGIWKWNPETEDTEEYNSPFLKKLMEET